MFFPPAHSRFDRITDRERPNRSGRTLLILPELACAAHTRGGVGQPTTHTRVSSDDASCRCCDESDDGATRSRRFNQGNKKNKIEGQHLFRSADRLFTCFLLLFGCRLVPAAGSVCVLGCVGSIGCCSIHPPNGRIAICSLLALPHHHSAPEPTHTQGSSPVATQNIHSPIPPKGSSPLPRNKFGQLKPSRRSLFYVQRYT